MVWIETYIKKIKEAATDAELEEIVQEIYDYGYQACAEDSTDNEDRDPPFEWHDLD